jgi:soluble lytic murein transglycosylase-like protein
MRLLAFTIAAALLSPLAAHAQIYAWHDANGTLVLSDRKLDGSAITYRVPDAQGIRATTPLTSAKYGQEFDSIVQETAARHSLRPALVRAVIQVESGFNPRARSPKGAMGLMQLMPATARDLGVRDPYDPADNIRGGVAYLRSLIDRYDGNEDLALAAYNAGAEAVDRHGKTIPPYQETQNYVKRVGAASGVTGGHASLTRRAVVYKTTQIVDGRAVPSYSSSKPASGAFEIVVQ